MSFSISLIITICDFIYYFIKNESEKYNVIYCIFQIHQIDFIHNT